MLTSSEGIKIVIEKSKYEVILEMKYWDGEKDLQRPHLLIDNTFYYLSSSEMKKLYATRLPMCQIRLLQRVRQPTRVTNLYSVCG